MHRIDAKNFVAHAQAMHPCHRFGVARQSSLHRHAKENRRGIAAAAVD
ncbi:MAG TPA: hypothetical protein VGG99_22725 [Acetobacteraceae bacterium]